MSEAIVTRLRPKPKDPTGARRQARFRRKRKSIVTVAKNAVADVSSPAPVADPTTPPPLAETGMRVLAPSNGNSGITVAALTAALSLAAVSGGFSISGMTSIFTGRSTR
jgi:hypothetical protein